MSIAEQITRIKEQRNIIANKLRQMSVLEESDADSTITDCATAANGISVYANGGGIEEDASSINLYGGYYHNHTINLLENDYCKDLTTEKNNLYNQTVTLGDEIDVLEADVASLEAEKKSLQSQVSTLTTEKNNLQSQVSTLTTEKNDLYNQTVTLGDEIDLLESDKQSLQNQVDQLEADLVTADNQRIEANNKYVALQNQVNAYEAELAAL